MPIPEWVEKWIEKLDDPITDIVCSTPDIGDIDTVDESRDDDC